METKEKNLWTRKRKTFTFCIVIAMIIVLSVSFVGLFKFEEEKREEEYQPYDSMYNASRFFFRVFYPDDWDVSADAYGFFLSEDTGLVLEAFPLKKIAATSSPTADQTASKNSPTPVRPTSTSKPDASASASIDPRAGMERNNDLTMSIHYYQYGDDLPVVTETPKPTSTPAPSATASPAVSPAESTGEKTPPVELAVMARSIFDDFKDKHKDDGYTFSIAKKFSGNTVEFYSISYNYIKDDIKMSGEVYVAVRAMAYYVIYVDGTASAFNRYNEVIENIIYNIKFSVFDY